MLYLPDKLIQEDHEVPPETRFAASAAPMASRAGEAAHLRWYRQALRVVHTLSACLWGNVC